MDNAEFSLNFLEESLRTDPDPSYYEHFFLSYAPEKWVSDVNGGLFQFFDETETEYSLTVQHSPNHGISLTYMFGEGFDVKTFVTIADAAKLADVIDVGVDEFVPIGSFISPEAAWPMVKAFLLDPKSIPDPKQMFDIEKTDWPDLYI